MGASVVEATGEAAAEVGRVATAETTRQTVAAGGRSAGAAVATAAGTAAAGAGRAANKLFDLTGATARQVGGQAAALVGGNGGGATTRQWVYVPPVAPGETVTIDVLVGAAGKLSGSQHIPFRLVSRALGEESAQPVIEEGSVQVSGGSPWRGLMAWVTIALAVLIAAVLVWWLIGVIF
jgi:hypothetical protein